MKAEPSITIFATRMAHWYCEHFHKLTSVYTDEIGKYQRCLDCGRRISRSDTLAEPDASGSGFYSPPPQRLVNELRPND